jgi:hypothetical protein
LWWFGIFSRFGTYVLRRKNMATLLKKEVSRLQPKSQISLKKIKALLLFV